MAYPNLKENQQMLEIETKNREIKIFRKRTEKYGHDNIFNNLKNHIDILQEKNINLQIERKELSLKFI